MLLVNAFIKTLSLSFLVGYNIFSSSNTEPTVSFYTD